MIEEIRVYDMLLTAADEEGIQLELEDHISETSELSSDDDEPENVFMNHIYTYQR